MLLLALSGDAAWRMTRRASPAVADTGAFEAAARRLAVSTSAVSQRIRALESALGRVLVRRGSPSTPTPDGEVVKALDLSGASNLLFRRNSVTGAVEAVPWKREGVELNADLHAND